MYISLYIYVCTYIYIYIYLSIYPSIYPEPRHLQAGTGGFVIPVLLTEPTRHSVASRCLMEIPLVSKAVMRCAGPILATSVPEHRTTGNARTRQKEEGGACKYKKTALSRPCMREKGSRRLELNISEAQKLDPGSELRIHYLAGN